MFFCAGNVHTVGASDKCFVDSPSGLSVDRGPDSSAQRALIWSIPQVFSATLRREFNLATEIVSALRSWKKYLLKSFGRDRLRLYFLWGGMLQGIELAKG